MATAKNSRVFRVRLLLILACLISLPTAAQYADGAHTHQTHKEDFETGDFSKFDWESYEDSNWFVTPHESNSGTYSAQSDSTYDNDSSTLEVELDCVTGDIAFYCKVSSESYWDKLTFYIDGVKQDEWSGEQDWTQVHFPVTAGERTFRWTYSKDESSSDGSDTAWIDDVEFPVKGTCVIEAGELRATLEDTGQGFRLLSLFDLVTDTEFMGPMPTEIQLFRIILKQTEGGGTVVLKVESGWNRARIDSTGDRSWLVTFESPTDPRITGIKVTLHIHVETISNAIHFSLRVQNVPEPWAIEKVRFPRLKLANHGPQTRVLVPDGCGRVLKESFSHFGKYPGTATMPYFAFYDSLGYAGLYVGTHDPWATPRDVWLGDRKEPDGIKLEYVYPAPNSDQAGNDFDVPGEAVLQLFRGDWYDATLIYRDWVRANAKWYPMLSENGREDTPLWMRELPGWIRTHNHTTIEDDVSWATQFSNFVGLPVGLRWFDWYQNPRPHFFPAKPGFVDAINALQGRRRLPIYVMPYICGVYWEVRDNGIDDFQFTSVGLSGAAKNEQGELFLSAPFDTASDGTPLRLARMCPASSVWKDILQELVLRVFTECGAKAVFIDGGASTPPLCFDHTHGHPTGGGHWGIEAYWEILQSIRRAMPSDCILVPEGNNEAYTHVYDGFLVQWDRNGNVPAFPAIYGGAIQMFGRFYTFGDRATKTQAHRMQGGQAFVFGEQTGGALRLPRILGEEETLQFLTQIALLRWELRRFFYAGEMARPPKVYGDIPTVTADWLRGDRDKAIWVTTDAVLTGAWRIPHEQRMVLLFVNVSDMPLTATLDFDAARYGLPTEGLTGTVIVSAAAADRSLGRYGPPSIPGEPSPIESKFQRVLHFPKRFAWAWIIEP